MILTEYTEVLEEGIKYFKNSKRIEKLIEKIRKKINIFSTPEEKKEVSKIMIALQEIAEEFKLLETEKMNNGNRYKLMKEYYTLEEKYSDIIKMINKESIIAIIKKASIASLFSVLLFVGFDFFKESGVSSSIIKGVALDKSAPDIAKETFKKVSSEEGRNAMKIGSEFQRGMAKAMTSGKIKNLDLEASEQAEAYLQSEKVVSAALAGTTAVSSTLIYKLFLKIFGSFRNKPLYIKTKMTLEKLGKL